MIRLSLALQQSPASLQIRDPDRLAELVRSRISALRLWLANSRRRRGRWRPSAHEVPTGRAAADPLASASVLGRLINEYERSRVKTTSSPVTEFRNLQGRTSHRGWEPSPRPNLTDTRPGHPDAQLSRTRAYVTRRTAEGKTPREIRRCLKGYIARELYMQLTQSMKTVTDH